MNRRGFMRMMVGGVVAGAAVRTWPFRVYSFPSLIDPYADMAHELMRSGRLFFSEPYSPLEWRVRIPIMAHKINDTPLNRKLDEIIQGHSPSKV